MKKIIKSIHGMFLVLKKENSNFRIDINELNKSVNNIPIWMQKNINDELTLLKIKKNDIDQTIQNLKNSNLLKSAELVKITIKKNKIYYKNYLSSKHHPRFIRLKNFLRSCLNLLTFPDIQFLYSIHDSFDNEKILKLLTAPVFCISKLDGNNNVILFPHIEWIKKNDELIDEVCKAALQMNWNDKINKFFWIGSTTGKSNFKENERYKIVKLTKLYPDLFNAYFSRVSGDLINVDVNFEEYFIRENFSPIKQIKYKYLLAIDGHAFAGSFFWQLFSGSLILKNKSNYLEWYYSGLRPNKHYIEYKTSLDLLEKIEFFNENETLARDIAQNAKDFAMEYLTNEMMIVYIKKLLESFSLKYKQNVISRK